MTGVGERVNGDRRVRVAVVWTHMAGFVAAELRALAAEGADVLLFCHDTAHEDAPFSRGSLDAGVPTHLLPAEPKPDLISRELDRFDPDAVIICSWHVGAYRRVGRRLRGRTLRIVTIPNQWHASPKQLAGRAAAPFVIQPTYDAAFVCDERQAVFAEKLGFPAERLIWGINTCDQPRFAAVARGRGGALPPRAFVYVGRLVPDKAIDVLGAAYSAYRRATSDPWPLLVAGTGPDEPLLRGRDGVDRLGFTQPDQLPAVLARAGCLVLPSRFEPWGVVIHEATAAGLPVICSRACGASTRLVLDGYNGVVVSPGRADALAAAFRRIHDADDEERQAMGYASEILSLQYTPQRWARTLLRRIPELRAQVGLSPTPWSTAVARSTTAAI